jgi:hypothetical protein
VNRAVEVGIVGCRAVVCGAVSGKFWQVRDDPTEFRDARLADRQIRSLVISVDLVGSRRTCPAHVDGSPVQGIGKEPAGSSR